ncbi:MAG: hypothetical protein M3O70_12215 [Actinomycetota bacterium]|nr:hypothetical protein [Actinomycetota bacterium]
MLGIRRRESATATRRDDVTEIIVLLDVVTATEEIRPMKRVALSALV